MKIQNVRYTEQEYLAYIRFHHALGGNDWFMQRVSAISLAIVFAVFACITTAIQPSLLRPLYEMPIFISVLSAACVLRFVRCANNRDRRTKEEQGIVDDQTEALTYRTVAALVAFERDRVLVNAYLEGRALGKLLPDAHMDRRAELLAEVRPRLDLAVNVTRFWRSEDTKRLLAKGLRPGHELRDALAGLSDAVNRSDADAEVVVQPALAQRAKDIGEAEAIERELATGRRASATVRT